jgi:hypothetical protein
MKMNNLPVFPVNRKVELRVIEGALDALLDSKRLLRTPLVEVYGVEGIGKTTLLLEVERLCRRRNIKVLSMEKVEDANEDFIIPTRKLLREMARGVVIIDSLDNLSGEQLQIFEQGLIELLDDRLLLVVMASSSEKMFENSRAITRLLTSFHLQSLSQEHSLEYLRGFGDRLSEAWREIIYDWTRGYPLAMHIMVMTIVEQNLDSSKEADRNLLLTVLVEKVIYQKLLSKVKGKERLRFETLITFLSVPRRFNLAIMQDVIEKFAKDYQLESTLDYISLPYLINEVVPVLYWNFNRVGFCIDEPVRNLFLLKLKYNEPGKYEEVHDFMANMNRRLAAEVSGPDHIRYIEEMLYHLAESGATPDRLVDEVVGAAERLGKIHAAEQLIQFREELVHDANITSALADKVSFVRSVIEEQIVLSQGHEAAEKPFVRDASLDFGAI